MTRLLAAACCALLAAPARAMKGNLEIEDDSRAVIVVDTFGFYRDGQITVKMKDFVVMVDGVEQLVQGNEIGLMVTNDVAQSQLLYTQHDPAGFCLPDIIESVVVWSWDNGVQEKTMEYTVQIGESDEYTIFFYNCKKGSKVDFKLGIELYNLEKNYLSAGDAMLPRVWFFFSFVFFIGLICWSLHLRSAWKHKHLIHILMTALVMLKVMTMLVDGIKMNYMARAGTGSAWDILWFFLYGVKGAALFTVIALIGSGWSFVKPFLSNRDKRIVMVILPLQVVSNIALVITEEGNRGNQDWGAWRDILHLFDLICCCAILFQIGYCCKGTLWHLREGAATDGMAAAHAEKVTLFRQFYVLVVSYIFFTRFIVFMLSATWTWQNTYWTTIATQSATFLFYAVTGYKFRPTSGSTLTCTTSTSEHDSRLIDSSSVNVSNGLGKLEASHVANPVVRAETGTLVHGVEYHTLESQNKG